MGALPEWSAQYSIQNLVWSDDITYSIVCAWVAPQTSHSLLDSSVDDPQRPAYDMGSRKILRTMMWRVPGGARTRWARTAKGEESMSEFSRRSLLGGAVAAAATTMWSEPAHAQYVWQKSN